MTPNRLTGLLLATLVCAAPPAIAGQERQAQPAVKADMDEIPVSLPRIRRELARDIREDSRFENFRLLTTLHVFGAAPGFELFTPEEEMDLGGYGGVRYGSPTHSEFVSQVQPRNFRAPVMNLSGGLFALGNWAAERRRDAQRRKEVEQERARMEAERRRQQQNPQPPQP